MERDARLSLLRRVDEPQRGWWDTVVGGFVVAGESAEEAMLREAEEEIGVRVTFERLVGTYASVYGDTGLQTLGIAFACSLQAGAELRISAESLEHAWFGPDELSALAFADVQAAAEAWRAGRVGV